MKYKKSDIRKWTNALRSGEYKQGKGRLQSHDGFCCLGLGVQIFVPDDKKAFSDGFLRGTVPFTQKYAPKWLKDINLDFAKKTKGYFLDSSFSLSGLNDNGYTFTEIADLIEAVYLYGAMDEPKKKGDSK